MTRLLKKASLRYAGTTENVCLWRTINGVDAPIARLEMITVLFTKKLKGSLN